MSQCAPPPRVHPPKDRRRLRQELGRLRAAFGASLTASVHNMSGEVLAEVEICAAKCVSELRCQVLLAIDNPPDKACMLMLDGKVLDDSKPLALAGFCSDDWEVREHVTVTFVRIPELWAAMGSTGGWVTLYCLSTYGELHGSSPRYVVELPTGPEAVTSVAFSPDG